MVSINPKLAQNYQVQTRKVAKQEEGSNHQSKTQETSTANVEPAKAEVVGSKTPLEKIKYDNVDSLLIGNGIKINKPVSSVEAVDTEMITYQIPNRNMLDMLVDSGTLREGDQICLEVGREDGSVIYLSFKVNHKGELVSTGYGTCRADYWDKNSTFD